MDRGRECVATQYHFPNDILQHRLVVQSSQHHDNEIVRWDDIEALPAVPYARDPLNFLTRNERATEPPLVSVEVQPQAVYLCGSSLFDPVR